MRKNIPKRIRFEVFKRDGFTCQYCGRSAPDVILEVDHINPVSKGGDNDIMNLVTSCKDCNRGKSNVKLSDNSVIKKQQAQIRDLADRNEQLEMILKWRSGLKDIQEREIDSFSEALHKYCEGELDIKLNENGRKNVKKMLKDYTIIELLDALDDAMLQYYDGTHHSVEAIIKKVSAIAYYKRHPMDEQQKKIYYLRKILINRLSYVNKQNAYSLIKNAMSSGLSFESIKEICSTCRNYSDFVSRLEVRTREENI